MGTACSATPPVDAVAPPRDPHAAAVARSQPKRYVSRKASSRRPRAPPGGGAANVHALQSPTEDALALERCVTALREGEARVREGEAGIPPAPATPEIDRRADGAPFVASESAPLPLSHDAPVDLNFSGEELNASNEHPSSISNWTLSHVAKGDTVSIDFTASPDSFPFSPVGPADPNESHCLWDADTNGSAALLSNAGSLLSCPTPTVFTDDLGSIHTL